MIGELHDLRCSGDPCVCERVYRVCVAVESQCAGEAADNLESRTAGLSRFPERSGRLRVTEGSL